MRPPKLQELLSAIELSAIETIKEFPDFFFDHAGIIPAKAASYQYDATPLNTTVFAATGGNGVHFSVLQISEQINPVVMTVPMNFSGSIRERIIILGESLAEFMSIGYYMG